MSMKRLSKIKYWFLDEKRHLSLAFSYWRFIRKHGDGTWNWAYALRIFGWKIKLMREGFEKYSRHENWERSVKQMRAVEFLIKRIIDDDYIFQNNIYERVEHDEKKRLAVVMHCEYLHKQDMDYLFKILKKHMTSWWD